jgi:Tol biopolymer transport system component
MKRKIYGQILTLLIFIVLLHSCKKTGIPALTTAGVTGITPTTAVSGGNVTDEGGLDVSERGVCWSTSESPAIINSRSIEAGGSGSFTSNLTSLTANTIYYVRAYATNDEGTGYGNQVTFSTGEWSLAALTTSEITSKTINSAISGGTISDDGGSTVTARGVCWGIVTGPTISGNKTDQGSGSGSFISNITGLQASTTYFVRAFATNSGGTVYGNELVFATPSATGEILLADGNSPAWSPDGSKIAFLKEQDLYIMNSDGTNQHKLTSGVRGAPAWSPDGNYLAFKGFVTAYDIFRINSSGTNKTNLTNNYASPNEPLWSPDGNKIAFTGSADGINSFLYIMNNDGTNIQNLTSLNTTLNPGFVHSWSANGSKILFSAGWDSARDLYFIDSDGTDMLHLEIDSLYEENAVLSSDGSKIYFAASNGAKWNIYAINSTATVIANLTGNNGINHNPELSSDGTKIAFSSYRNSEDALYIMSSDGSNQQRYSGPGVSNSEVQWSPDGSKIVFTAYRQRAGGSYASGVYTIPVQK